jgi:hypothetical protein
MQAYLWMETASHDMTVCTVVPVMGQLELLHKRSRDNGVDARVLAQTRCQDAGAVSSVRHSCEMLGSISSCISSYLGAVRSSCNVPPALYQAHLSAHLQRGDGKEGRYG